MKKSDIIIIIILIIAPVLTGLFMIPFITQSGPSKSTSFIKTFQKKVGVIELEGVIYSSRKVVKQLKQFEKDDKIKGVIIHVNSPGGAVAPSQEIYQQLLDFRDRTSKPIYISMGTVAASGGYYIAAAGDKIFANSGTLTGSIGVIMQFSHYYELLKKIGVDVSTITAGRLKDAGSPYRTLSSTEKGYFDDLLKDTHEQFILDVATAREMNIDTLRQFTEGQIFTGNMALQHGLIDTIGTYEECKSAILYELNLPSTTEFVTPTNEEKSGLSLFLEGRSSIRNAVNILLPKSGVYFLATELQ